ncbi:MAG: GSCFA domain-containing protein [Saprospiraceae bacterium]
MSISDHDIITCVKPDQFWPKLSYTDPIFLTGSCFAEHIGAKLSGYKYNVLSNPFGILFNPVSIASSFERIEKKEFYSQEELVLQDGIYHSMDHHGSFSGKDPKAVVEAINNAIELSHHHLTTSRFVFISLGSAKVYRYLKTKAIIGNCHKIPQQLFESFRLTLNECIFAVEKAENSIRVLAPEAHIIWTVSPVRHLRDGFGENQMSKSTLHLAIDEIIKNHLHNGCFPAYEIMIDQLRDYRYYARDLVHPSPLAIDIIWDIFAGTYLDPLETSTHEHIEKIQRATEHRFLHDDDEEGRKIFAARQLKNIELLELKYPKQNWVQERTYFSQLK